MRVIALVRELRKKTGCSLQECMGFVTVMKIIKPDEIKIMCGEAAKRYDDQTKTKQ